MRPRVFPAEDPVYYAIGVDKSEGSFNEAAGIPRGRHMCPRHMAAQVR